MDYFEFEGINDNQRAIVSQEYMNNLINYKVSLSTFSKIDAISDWIFISTEFPNKYINNKNILVINTNSEKEDRCKNITSYKKFKKCLDKTDKNCVIFGERKKKFIVRYLTEEALMRYDFYKNRNKEIVNLI